MVTSDKDDTKKNSLFNFYHEVGDKVIFDERVLNEYSYNGFFEYKKYLGKIGIVTEINKDLHCTYGTSYTNDVQFGNDTIKCMASFFKTA